MLTSAVILGSSIVGCSGAGVQQRPASVSRPQMLAPLIEKALAEKKYDRALAQAEELVAATPADASHRSLLGRTYLANGRYTSARIAFQDAMTLGNRDVRTIVSLALADIGLGNAQAARDLLADHISDLPAADYGLAMAMAGNAEEGVRALVAASRQPEATMQTRQNLAYALALGGAWGQARLIAGQDLSARDAEQRIGEWSRGGTGQDRVIAMLGVAPRGDDIGVPVRLALRGGADEPPAPVQVVAVTDLVAQARGDASAQAQLAVSSGTADLIASSVAEIAPDMIEAPAIQAAQVMLRQAVPPAGPAALPIPAASPDAATLMAIFAHDEPAVLSQDRTASDPMRQAVRAAFKRSEAPPPVATSRPIVRRPAAPVASSVTGGAGMSDWVVQLGAFDSAAIAREKWQQIRARQSRIGGFDEVFSEITVDGRVFHRLAIRGFGNRNMAWATCRSLSAAGQACFVRLDDQADSRMARGTAHKNGQEIAAR